MTTESTRVLVVDDHPLVREGLIAVIRARGGLVVAAASQIHLDRESFCPVIQVGAPLALYSPSNQRR